MRLLGAEDDPEDEYLEDVDFFEDGIGAPTIDNNNDSDDLMGKKALPEDH